MTQRPACRTCAAPAAINYKKNDRVYYRSECEACMRAKKNKAPAPPVWQLSGYTKLMQCEKCAWRARFANQLAVRSTTGNLRETHSLKTVCLNCQAELDALGVLWLQTGLRADN